jgi:hypothetical protein
MKKIFLMLLLFVSSVQAAFVGPAMNVSGSGSDYIFVYRGNNPQEFDALLAQGLSNLAGWIANCTSQGCTTSTFIIDHATLPDPDYLFLYTKDSTGNPGFPDSGFYYSFNSPPPPPPPLCCSGSAVSFPASATNTVKAQAFIARTTNDSQVYIDQIGNGNTIAVSQSGTKNNKVTYEGNGSNNDISVTQSGNSSTVLNYVDLKVVGNNNTANINQQSSGGGKGAFVSINDSSNIITLQQKDSGSHYADIFVSGGNKQIDVLQQGSAGHMAKIDLSGNPTNLSLTQSGSNQQFYSIQFNCATLGRCATIQVQQGQ